MRRGPLGTEWETGPGPSERQSGVENSGKGKTCHKTPPQKRFLDALMDNNLATPPIGGKWARNWKWPKKWLAKWGAGGHFRGGPQNGRKMARQTASYAENGQKFNYPAICPAILRPFCKMAPPRKWLPAISPAIFRPFPVSGPFPPCSRSAGSQHQPDKLHFLRPQKK